MYSGPEAATMSTTTDASTTTNPSGIRYEVALGRPAGGRLTAYVFDNRGVHRPRAMGAGECAFREALCLARVLNSLASSERR